MKYICRVDRERHHCWKVGIAGKQDWGVTKDFFDRKCGGKDKSLDMAIKWRDKQLELLKNRLAEYVPKGWRETWYTRGGRSYLYIVTSYTKKYKKKIKRFSVNKYGYDEAVRLALEWRKLQLIGSL